MTNDDAAREAAELLTNAGPCVPKHRMLSVDLPMEMVCKPCAEAAMTARLRERNQQIALHESRIRGTCQVLGIAPESSYDDIETAIVNLQENCECIAALESQVRERDERIKRLAFDSGYDGTFMGAYAGEELSGEECPLCRFPCDTRYATIMGIGDDKVAHLLCAYSILRERIAALEKKLEAL